MASDEAFVTLATNDSYGLGALVLGHSLRQSGTSRNLAVLITPGVTQSMRNQLSSVYDLVQLVDVLDSQDAANLALLARPELGITLTKIHAWNLLQYKKAVFLDADTLVLQNVDDLFEREELSAVPDVGWPDCFNTGVFVFRPSAQTYGSLIQFAIETGSFDGGDQGLLNSYFNDWATKDIKTHLPFVYNMVATVIYSYAPAFKQFGQNVKIVHFLGSTKPWHQTTSESASSVVLGNFLQLWWNIFNAHVRGGLEPGLAGLAGNIASLNLGAEFGSIHGGGVAAYRQASHRRDWESGNIDYMGADSYENIQRRIQASIGPESTAQPVQKKEPSPPRTTPQRQSSPPQHTHASTQPAHSQPQQGAKQPTPPPQSSASQQKQAPAHQTPGHPQQQQHAPAHQVPAHPQQQGKQSSPPPQVSAGQPAQASHTAPQQVKQPTPPPQTGTAQQAKQAPPVAQTRTAQPAKQAPPPAQSEQARPSTQPPQKR